jgi:mannose-6-phosphate isomerase
MSEYYPLKLAAVPKAKVWGGNNLTRLLGKSFASDAAIGETWEAHEECLVENGEHAGTALRDVIAFDPSGILGAAADVSAARFPLLFKFIDAADDLSVQVHPDDAAAQKMAKYPFGKTEAWYVIHAESEAALIHGFKENVTPGQVRQALAQQVLPDLLCSVAVETGDVVFVPAGTVHAITRGIVVAEIQENSDITYRLYDWGRAGKGRNLHIEQSLAVARLETMGAHKIPRLTIQRETYDRHFLTVCRYFSFEMLDLGTQMRFDFEKWTIISFISGAATINYGVSWENSVQAKLGDTFILPAALGSVDIAASERPCRALIAYVPDLWADVIVPLQRAGYRDREIAQLGGSENAQNDLINLLS